MRRRFTTITLLLLILWVPATSHCMMESAGMIAIAGCCAKSLTDCSQDDCATGCSVVERTFINSPAQTTNLSLPSLIIQQLLPLFTPQECTRFFLCFFFCPPI